MFRRRIVQVLQYNLGARSDDMDDGLLSAEISSAIEKFYIVSLKKLSTLSFIISEVCISLLLKIKEVT